MTKSKTPDTNSDNHENTINGKNSIMSQLCTSCQQQNQQKEWYKIDVGKKGRGLFAIRPIPPFTHIHTAPCILITNSEYESHMKHTILEHYLFNCPGSDDSKDRLLALGHGSLFNHDASTPNVDYKLDVPNLLIHYTTSYRHVNVGDELCIYYGNKLWFQDEDKNSSRNDHDDEDNNSIQEMDLFQITIQD